MAEWRFRKQHPDENVRNPIQGEYFSDEAIERPAQALVREAIQNSLDARLRNGGNRAASVRFLVSGSEAALDAAKARYWFGSAWDHFSANKNGLRDAPTADESCPYLVVEDFGTTGLEGDPAEWEPPEEPSDNRFFAFFRAEGVSQKHGQQGGRWGVGKTVFPRASRINTLFGLTVRRSDSRPLLMGRSVLFYHRVQNHSFASDGFFGDPRDDGLVLPLDNQSILERFGDDFSLRRGGEPGLSVVVPYLDPEITAKDVLASIIREYFYPILTGMLSVSVEGSGITSGNGELTSDSLVQILAGSDESGDAGLRDVIDLALWARDTGLVTPNALEIPGIPPTWMDEIVPAAEMKRIASQFREGVPLAFRVRVKVDAVDQPEQPSYFDVCIKRDLNDRGYPPVFIRNGIIIPKVRERRVKGHRIIALTVIDDEPLANLLGDAETPAHTHWSKDTQHFKGKYRYGDAYIRFVSEAPRQLAEILSKQQEEKDRLILADFFPRPPEEASAIAKPEPTPEEGPQSEPPEPPLPPSSEPYVIERLEGGFQLKRGDRGIPCPKEIMLRAAYDRTRGNPLAKYHRADFDMANMSIETTAATVLENNENYIKLRIDQDDFRVIVKGFDINRDVYVRTNRVSATDDQTI